MRNICPSEARSMNTIFFKKNLQNNEMHYNNPKTMQFSQKKSFLQTNLNPLEHPLCSWKEK